MIPARHRPWANFIFWPYLLRLLRRHFHTIGVIGEIPEFKAELPLLLLPNHNTWWDGFIVYGLNKWILRRKLYIMMLEKQLIKYKFFSKLGAYSVEPDSPKSILASLEYSCAILNEHTPERQTMACIFPQGQLVPVHTPLRYKNGIERIVSNFGRTLQIAQLAIRLEFGTDQRPEIFLHFGEILECDHTKFPGVGFLQDRHTELLQNLAASLQVQPQNKTELLRGAASVNRTFERYTFQRNL